MRHFLYVVLVWLAAATALQARIIELPRVEVAAVVFGAEHSTTLSITIDEPLEFESRVTGSEVTVTVGTLSPFRVWKDSSRRIVSTGTAFPVEITFTPLELGINRATILLFLESQQKIDTVRIPIVGVGLPLRIVPRALEFVTQIGKTQERSFSMFNDGAVSIAVQVSDVSFPFSLSQGQGGTTLTVDAWDSTTVVVRCAADIGGIYNNQLVLSVVSGSLQGSIDSVELRATVQTSNAVETLNFGGVLVGASKKLSYQIHNPLDKPVTFTIGKIIGDNSFAFVKPTADTVFVLARSTAEILVEFVPRSKGGEVSGRFVLGSHDQSLPVTEILLQGKGINLEPIRLQVGRVSANVGDVVPLPITAVIPSELFAELVKSNIDTLAYSFEVVLNASVAHIANAPSIDTTYIEMGNQVVRVQGKVSLVNSSTAETIPLAPLSLRALLGDAVSTPIRLRDVAWFRGNAVVAQSDEMPEGVGELTIANIFTWPNGEKRLLNTRRGTLELVLAPNPMSSSVTIGVSGFTGEATVSLYTPLGEQVFQKTIARPSSFAVARSEIPNIAPGLYYCRLSAGRYSLVKLLRVE